MRRAADKARKRPAVAADPAAHAAEVEAVPLRGKFGRALGIDRNIRHQCAPDCFPASAKYRAADPAARSVGADQDLRFENSAVGDDPHAVRVLSHVEHANPLHDFDSRLAGRPRQHRVEPVAANHRAQHVAAARQIDAADRSCRLAANHFDGRHVERDSKLVEREHRLGNQAAGAHLEPRMRRFLDHGDSTRKAGPILHKKERGRQSRGTGPGDRHVKFSRGFHRPLQRLASELPARKRARRIEDPRYAAR